MDDPAAQQPTHRGGVKSSGLGVDDLRKKREQYTVSIRKNKREESLNKRRNMAATLAQASVVAATPSMAVTNTTMPATGFSTAPPQLHVEVDEDTQEDIQEKEAAKFRVCARIEVFSC